MDPEDAVHRFSRRLLAGECLTQAWWFITSLGHKPELGETLPISYFPVQETQLYKTSTRHEAFRGGRGSITLLRYIDSPIGNHSC